MQTSARRRFQPSLWPTLATALLVTLFFSAGQWQWNKAERKSALQQQAQTRGVAPVIRVPVALIADAQSWHYRKVVARGQYEPEHQILIDNRILHEQAGYHVITPLRLENSETRLLVNRGWVAASPDRRQLPQISTPSGTIEAIGTAIVPSTRFITLGVEEKNSKTEWQGVWQNLDMERFGKAVSFPLQPVVVQLDPDNRTAGGFAREWSRPDDRRQTNLNYAIQWWTFAATTVVFWLVVNYRRPS